MCDFFKVLALKILKPDQLVDMHTMNKLRRLLLKESFVCVHLWLGLCLYWLSLYSRLATKYVFRGIRGGLIIVKIPEMSGA